MLSDSVSPPALFFFIMCYYYLALTFPYKFYTQLVNLYTHTEGFWSYYTDPVASLEVTDLQNWILQSMTMIYLSIYLSLI